MGPARAARGAFAGKIWADRMAQSLSPPARPRRRWFRRLLLTILITAVAAGAFAYWRVRAPLPTVNGSIRLEGLRAPVQVIRDVDSVPHIRAEHEADALFALGYVHAQERLWQMEIQRRLAWGRLSEFAGDATLETDRLMRTIGLGRAAAAAWLKLAPDARAAIESYVAGINAFLASHRGGALPVEFAILRISPEPFRGEDVLAFYKAMAWLLSANWGEELLRHRIGTQVGDEAANQLMPAYTTNGPIVLPTDAAAGTAPAAPGPTAPGTPAGTPLMPGAPLPKSQTSPPIRGDAVAVVAAQLARAVESWLAPVPGGGSNNWVLSGARTVTGMPLLANDPHLAGSMPGIWYLAHVTGGRLDAIGATIPGLPGVIIGHNAKIAWGITAMLADVQDLYVEHINARDQAEYVGTWEPMSVLREVIRVRGHEDVPLRVRLTRHGPLVSDVLDRPPAALSLRWTGHDADDQTASAILKANLAQSWDEFTGALALAHAPALNFVYADVAGNIGYFGPGAFPVRAGSDGRRPMPGWTGEHEWRGYIHPSEWPRAYNPARGYVASANNKVVRDDYPFLLSTSWEAPYRATRIVDLITATTKFALEDVARMQRDVRTAQAAVVVPFLLRARPLDSRGRDAMDRLRNWDGTMSADSPDAALYDAWYSATIRGMFEDELGATLFKDYWRVRNLSAKALDALVEQGETEWCDDVRTPEPETCATLLGHTLQRALTDMSEAQGTRDISRWRWDTVNAAAFPHAPFDAVPSLKWAFSRRVPLGGNAFTVTPVMPLRDEIFISSYRQIIDLASFDASRFVIPAGQSGHVWSPQYDDLLPRWTKVEYIPMRFTRDAVDAAQAHRLVLEPG